MKKDIIHIDNYLLILGEDEIKIGDWYYDELVSHWKGVGPLKMIGFADDKTDRIIIQSEAGTTSPTKTSNKITHHLPLNGAKILDGVALLPEMEDRVNVLAEKSFEHMGYNSNVTPYEEDQHKLGFRMGYKQAREEYQFTEWDIRKAIQFGQGMELWKEEEQVNRFIQSLNQTRYPKYFEFEMECPQCQDWGFVSDCRSNCNKKFIQPKTFINTSDQLVAVGTYKF